MRMFSIDLNCDLGEGMGTDAAIMPYISSANIACGYHAGDQQTMSETVGLCTRNSVAIGAHPSFDDRENFGRKEQSVSTVEIRALITKQLEILSREAEKQGARLHHVKPHGALYNQSAKNISVARAIAEAVRDFDPQLVIYGLSGSHSVYEARALGLRAASEVFADRTYQDDGTLTPRGRPEALVENVQGAVQQALHLVKDSMVRTISGKELLLVADTICLHGDGKQAVRVARAIFEALKREDIIIMKI
ncbi:MAG TPA: 5-oxoprolinase subunit PxpA [Chitinophagaceae bacterium]|nr:5-oxoprolinase subunit PxpA [Chitinophagaceae bacterium]